MNIWVFINNLVAGLVTGVTFAIVPNDPVGDHPAYQTAWAFGVFVGLAAALSVFYVFGILGR